MKKFLLLSLFILPLKIVAQINGQETLPADAALTVVETMPEFPGGQDALSQFLAKNLKYPKKSRRKGIEGRIFAAFVVDKSGVIRDIKIVKGLSEECDMEVLRVLKLMPPWKPGMQDGKPVNVQFNLPVKFQLE